MSSYGTRMARNIAERSMTKEERKEARNKPQQHTSLADGGYAVLHPTRGWRIFTGRRLAAQRRMAQLLGA